MKILNNTIKCLCLAALLTGCSDWTKPESVDLYVPNLKDQNPALYKEYLESLREYKSSEHKVMIVKYDNISTAPAGRADHITSLPDSIDYVIMNNPADLSDIMKKEMEEIRTDKATKSLFTVSYDDIYAEYKLYLEEWNAAHQPAEGAEDTGSEEMPIELNEYLKTNVGERLGLFDHFGYDGVNVYYAGLSPLSYPEEEREKLAVSQGVFFGLINEFLASHSDAAFIFEGAPQNLIDKDILQKAEFIVIPALSANNSYSLSYEVEMAAVENVPTDRFVIGVTAISLTNPKDLRGYFNGTDSNGEQNRAITGAGYWVASDSDSFTHSGVLVNNAKNDYYNISMVYKYIRTSISIMNPSPLN